MTLHAQASALKGVAPVRRLLAAACAACFLLAPAFSQEMDLFAKYGSSQIDRYGPRRTGINNEILQIQSLPNGDIAFLTTGQMVTFNGTYWSAQPQFDRPSSFVRTTDGHALIGYAGGVAKAGVNPAGETAFSDIAPQGLASLALQAPRQIAFARDHVFASNGNTLVVVFPDGSSQSYDLDNWATTFFSIGDEIYATGGNEYLLNRWDWDRRALVNHQDVLSGSVYEWITHFTPRQNGGVWMLTKTGKLIGFDGEKTWLWPGNAAMGDLSATITDFVETGPDRLALATNTAGIYIFDEAGRKVRVFSRDNGLETNSVTRLGTDQQGGLWAATAKSVNRIIIEPTTLLFDERHGLPETVTALEFFDGLLHLATPSGIYRSNPNATSMDELFELAYDVKGGDDLLSYRDTLIVAGDEIVAITKTGQQTVISPTGGTCLWQPSRFPDTILIGNYQGVFKSHWFDGHWLPAQKLTGSVKEVFAFAESAEGAIFGGNGDDAITQIHLFEGGYGHLQRLPLEVPLNGTWTSPATIEGQVYVNTTPALLWDDAARRFTPQDEIGYFKGPPPYGFDHVFADGNGNAWANRNSRSGRTLPRPSKKVVGDITTLDDASEARAKCLAYDEKGRAWAGGVFGLVFAPKPHDNTQASKPVAGIHRLVSLRDGVELPVATGPNGYLQLEPHQNSLRIEVFLQSYLSAAHNTYQILLEGFDTELSAFEAVPFREFTNLEPGIYKIMVNGLNASGQQSYFELPIYIATPWYHKYWAYALYAATATCLILLVSWILSRNQVRRRKRLERIVLERTQEVEQQNAILARQAETLEIQNEQLEQKTEELTATTETLTSTLSQLQEMQDQLLATARTAGKAEVAINVLHNVGNVLNSLNVSIALLTEKASSSKVKKLSRVVSLLEERKSDIEDFLTKDPKGKAVPEYLIHLSSALGEELDAIQHELAVMGEDIEHIKSIVAAQQSHAKNQGLYESVYVRDLCETALSIQGNDKKDVPIEISNDVPEDLVIETEKHKLLDILLNLVANAEQAILEEKPDLGIISFAASLDEERQSLELTVSDNGCGFDQAIKDKLFRHGFTTKKEGHGFGLHGCANSATTMAGSLELESPGKHQGATARLVIPTKQPKGEPSV